MSLRDYFEARGSDGSWARLYEGAPDAGSYNFHTRRRAVAELLKSEGAFTRVLDVGCGTGDYAALAAQHGGRYFGIDFANAMVREGRARTSRAGHAAHFAVGAGQSLPFGDDTFDLVLGMGYIAYFEDPEPALMEIRRVLEPGGVLILQSRKSDLWGAIDRELIHPLRALLGRRPPGPPPGWVSRPYSPRALDRMLARFDFERTDRAFDHFNTTPGFMRRRLPGLHIRVSELLSRHYPAWWRLLAVNYIGKYRLKVGRKRTRKP